MALLKSTPLDGGGDRDGGQAGAAGGPGNRVSRRGGADALMPCGSAVHTHWEVVVSKAVLEDTRVIVGGHIPEAAHDVVNVLAVFRGIGTSASAETELSVRDERGPLVIL